MDSGARQPVYGRTCCEPICRRRCIRDQNQNQETILFRRICLNTRGTVFYPKVLLRRSCVSIFFRIGFWKVTVNCIVHVLLHSHSDAVSLVFTQSAETRSLDGVWWNVLRRRRWVMPRYGWYCPWYFQSRTFRSKHTPLATLVAYIALSCAMRINLYRHHDDRKKAKEKIFRHLFRFLLFLLSFQIIVLAFHYSSTHRLVFDHVNIFTAKTRICPVPLVVFALPAHDGLERRDTASAR